MRAAVATTIARKLNQIPSTIRKESQIQLMRMSTRATEAKVEFPVHESIVNKLNAALEPSILKVLNESHMHNV